MILKNKIRRQLEIVMICSEAINLIRNSPSIVEFPLPPWRQSTFPPFCMEFAFGRNICSTIAYLPRRVLPSVYPVCSKFQHALLRCKQRPNNNNGLSHFIRQAKNNQKLVKWNTKKHLEQRAHLIK